MSTPRVADIPLRQTVARRIARFLRFMRGRVVPADMLIDYVYGDRQNGPPKYPRESIHVIVSRLYHGGFPVGSVRKQSGFVWDEGRVFIKRRKQGQGASNRVARTGSIVRHG